MSTRSMLDQLSKDLLLESGGDVALILVMGTAWGDLACPAILAERADIQQKRAKLCDYLRHIIRQLEEAPEDRVSVEVMAVMEPGGKPS